MIELVLLLTLASGAHYRFHDGVALNDVRATPGVIAIRDAKQVCSVKWGKDERHVTEKMKNQVYLFYGIDKKQVSKELCQKQVSCQQKLSDAPRYEIDHVISRELGGADDTRNLFPQPYYAHPGAHEKDKLENWLHKQVCAGKMDLAEAQRQIALDWYQLYLEMEAGK